jgi:phage tail-like protein
VTVFRNGSDPTSSLKAPGRTEYGPITLSRGVTQDTAFEDWANNVWRSPSQAGAATSSSDFRKTVTIELLNDAGQLVVAHNVLRCWPSQYVAFAELDPATPRVLIESITLQNEGWERAR